MIRIDVDQASPSPSGLRLGLTVRYGKDGPVRFAQAWVPWDLLTGEVVAAIGAAHNRALDREPDDVPLF